MLSLVYLLLLCCTNCQIYSIVSFCPWLLRMGSREGGQLEVVIPSDNSQLEMGHQSDGPNLWDGKENLLSVSPAWSLEPPKLMAWEQGGKLSQGRPAGSGLLSLHGAERLQEFLGELDLDNWGAEPVRLVLLSLSALPEAFLLYLRGSKPTCPECSRLPGQAKGINTQCSMNLMYVSHIAFLISCIFIAVESNKLQYH